MRVTATYRRRGSSPKVPDESLAVWCRHHELLDAIEQARPELWHQTMFRWAAVGCLLATGFMGGLVVMNRIFGGF